MTIDELVDKLAKPIYVLRMARPLEGNRLAPHTNPSMVKSARTRANNARYQIEDLVEQYVLGQHEHSIQDDLEDAV